MASNVLLVTGSYDHSLIFWDAYNGTSIQEIQYPDNQIINRIEISSDKKFLGCAANLGIRVYDIPSQSTKPQYSFDEYSANVTGVGFQKDCNWIYASSEDGSIRIFDLRASGYKREYREKEKENQFPINTVVLHPNEAELIAGDSQGNLKIYDLVADKIRLNQKLTSDIALRSISIALNAQCLVAADSAGIVHYWQLKNAEDLIPQPKIEAHNDYILKCLISPDCRYMVTCSADKTIKVFRLTSDKGYQLLRTLYGHSKWVWDAAFSIDSEFLITVSTDQVAKIWQTETGEVIRNLKQHKKGINCLALNDY